MAHQHANYSQLRDYYRLERNRLATGMANGLLGILGMAGIALLLLFLMTGCAQASQYCPATMFRANCLPVSGYTCTDIVEAIGKAEHSKAHPYGIMIKYKHTDPWQACMNTIKHQVMNYIREGCTEDFFTYLARHYAPVGASNDPNNLNVNWKKNVKYFLAKNK